MLTYTEARTVLEALENLHKQFDLVLPSGRVHDERQAIGAASSAAALLRSRLEKPQDHAESIDAEGEKK